MNVRLRSGQKKYGPGEDVHEWTLSIKGRKGTQPANGVRSVLLCISTPHYELLEGLAGRQLCRKASYRLRGRLIVGQTHLGPGHTERVGSDLE